MAYKDMVIREADVANAITLAAGRGGVATLLGRLTAAADRAARISTSNRRVELVLTPLGVQVRGRRGMYVPAPLLVQWDKIAGYAYDPLMPQVAAMMRKLD